MSSIWPLLVAPLSLSIEGNKLFVLVAETEDVKDVVLGSFSLATTIVSIGITLN